jgi:hypothetical protein
VSENRQSAAKVLKTQRRTRMAVKRAAGVPVTQIARQEGISRQWASAELSNPESQAIIAAMVDQHRERAQNLVPRLFAAIEDALEARKEYVLDGVPFEGGPDHYARLTAITRYQDLMKLGRAAPAKPAEEKSDRLITMDDIRRVLAEAQQAAQ